MNKKKKGWLIISLVLGGLAVIILLLDRILRLGFDEPYLVRLLLVSIVTAVILVFIEADIGIGLIVSLVLGFGLGLIIAMPLQLIFFEFENPNFAHWTFWVPALCSAIMLLGIRQWDWIKKKAKLGKRCKCGKQANDCLVTDGERRWFCRTHMIEAWRAAFIKSPQKLIAFSPNFDGKKTSYTYAFTALEEIEAEGLQLVFHEKVTKAIKKQETCSCCKEDATVAYFITKEYKDSEAPSFDDPGGPELLCRSCAADRIVQSLRNFKGDFGESICMPDKRQGILYPFLM